MAIADKIDQPHGAGFHSLHILKNVKLIYMLITLKKEVEETVELSTPAWFVDRLGFYAHVTEGGDLIEVYGNTVSLKEASPATEVAIAQVVRDYFGCTEHQFKEALDQRLFKFEESYTKA